MLDAETSLADQVNKEEAQLEGEGEEHDEQVGKGKELIPTFHEAEIGQVVGGHICQGQDSIRHDVGAFLNPRPHLLESRFRATTSFLCFIIGGARGTATGGDLEARHWEKLMSSLNNDVPSTEWEGRYQCCQLSIKVFDKSVWDVPT